MIQSAYNLYTEFSSFASSLDCLPIQIEHIVWKLPWPKFLKSINYNFYKPNIILNEFFAKQEAYATI